MARLPVGQNDDARPEFAEDADYAQAILESVFDGAVGQGERPAPANAQNARGFFRLAGALFRRAASASLALGQIENRSAQTARRHAQQRSAATLLHVVAMRGDGQNVGAKVEGFSGHGN